MEAQDPEAQTWQAQKRNQYLGSALGCSFLGIGVRKERLIHMPTEKELYEKGIFTDEG